MKTPRGQIFVSARMGGGGRCLFYSLISSAWNGFWHIVQELKKFLLNEPMVFFICPTPLPSTSPFLGMTEFSQSEEWKVR